MIIDLTFGQLVAMCEYLGYTKMLPANEGYIDTAKNELVMFGPTCPIEEAIPDDCTFEVVSLEEDKWKVVPKMTKVPTKAIEFVRKAFSYLGEEAQLVANGEAMTDTDIDYCKKGLSAMRSAIEAFPQFAKDYGKQ